MPSQLPAAPPSPHRLNAVVFLGALSTLALEVALTRLASALFFTQVTALLLAASLAALGLGAAFVHRTTLRRPPSLAQLAWLAGAGALSGAVALLCAVHAPLLFIAGVFAGPFLCAGAFAATAYRLSPQPSTTFAWEALGGAVGAVLGPCLLALWGDMTAALVALLLLLPVGVLLASLAPRALGLFAPVVALLAAHLLLSPSPLEPDPFATPVFLPHLVEQTRPHHGRVLQTRVDSYARTDLVQTDEPWLRYLYTDRMYAARAVRWDGHAPRFPDDEPNQLARLKRLPFHALGPARVLVLGAGGGFDVALALQEGAQDVDTVEVNAAMIGFVQALGEFCGRVYARPDVHVHAEEARQFLRRGHARWDLVQLSLMQSDAAALRSIAGAQSWVLTVEAVRAYLDNLTPGGTLAIVQNTLEFADRSAWTVAAALRQRGVAPEEIAQHLVALALPEAEHNPFGQLLLVRAQAFTQDERVALLAHARAVGALPRSATAPPLNFALPTDSHPTFYPPRPVLLALDGGLAVAALTVAWWLLLRRRRAGQPLPVRVFAQSVLLGAGLMLVQAALLGDAQFLLGIPPLAMAWTVGGLLAASALGALAGHQLRLPPEQRLRWAALLVALLLVHLLLFGPTARFAAPLPPSLAHLAVALLVLPLGFALGPCFPAFLQLAGGEDGRHRPALYAADGLGAVAGGGLAALLYAESGAAAVVAAALACYLALVWLARPAA